MKLNSTRYKIQDQLYQIIYKGTIEFVSKLYYRTVIKKLNSSSYLNVTVQYWNLIIDQLEKDATK